MMPSSAPAALTLPTSDTSIHAAALLYADAGFAPVPVHGVRGGRCTCGRADCAAIGKHPVGRDWQKRALADRDTARDLFDAHQGNIGIVVGAEHVVIDIDGYAGGYEGLGTLPALPPTLTSRSGSGEGEHRIFRLAPGQDAAEITNRKIAPGVDVKTRAGQIVVAPSLHRSGRRYEWTDTSAPALLPDALYEQIRKRRVVPIRPSGQQSDLTRRFRAYVDKIDPAVAGQNGHGAAFAAARACWAWVRKGLPEGEARAWFFGDFNSKCLPPWSERELEHKWTEASRSDSLPALEDRPASDPASAPAPFAGPLPPVPAVPTPPEDEWRDHLLFDQTRAGPKLSAHHENAVVVLRFHPAWRGKVAFDEHAQRVTVTAPPWHPSDAPRSVRAEAEWTDSDSARLSAWLRRELSVDISQGDCDRAVTIAAESNPIHPFRDWLDSLRWDGAPRLGSWLSVYLGVESSPYASSVGRWWLCSAVARTYQPGCKADLVLILEGAQGVGKSSALRLLAGSRWFSDTPIDIGSKDAYLALQGRTIVELAELDSFKRADADRAKSFFSSPSDQFRPPYGKRTITVQRSCVFAGTVNHSSYLTDDTGNRRFLPVRCQRIDIPALSRDRDQLWAEAVASFRAGARWWPETAEDTALCQAQQAPREQGDAWTDIIARYLDGREQVAVANIMKDALGMDVARFDRGSQMRVSRILGAAGWTRRQVRNGTKREWVYVPGVGQ